MITHLQTKHIFQDLIFHFHGYGRKGTVNHHPFPSRTWLPSRTATDQTIKLHPVPFSKLLNAGAWKWRGNVDVAIGKSCFIWKADLFGTIGLGSQKTGVFQLSIGSNTPKYLFFKLRIFELRTNQWDFWISDFSHSETRNRRCHRSSATLWNSQPIKGLTKRWLNSNESLIKNNDSNNNKFKNNNYNNKHLPPKLPK